MPDKEKAEERIQDFAVRLKELDPSANSEFRTARNKLIEALYIYATSSEKNGFKKTDVEEHGVEFYEKVNECIKYYDSSKGDFLHYFKHSWSMSIRQILAETSTEENHGGMKIVNKRDFVLFDRYVKQLRSSKPQMTDEEITARLQKELNWKPDRIKEYEEYKKVKLVDSEYKDSEGNVMSRFDAISSSDQLLEDQVIQQIDGSSADWIFAKIEKVFEGLQERQKLLASDLLTQLILEKYDSDDIDSIRKYSFVSDDIIMRWKNGDETLPQQYLTEKHGRKSTDISRVKKNLLEKLKALLKVDRS